MVAAIICKLSKVAALELEQIDFDCNRPPWSARLFESEFDHAHSRVYGARLAGDLVGFLVVHAIAGEAHIITFGVRNASRNQGVGRALVTQVLRDLYAEGVESVTLEVRRSNQIAQMLYASLGFVERGTRAKYYTDNQEDAIVLRLQLIDFISQNGRS